MARANSTMLRMSAWHPGQYASCGGIVVVIKLTNKVFLARPNFQADEANDACDYRECSHSKGQNDRSGCLEDTLDEKGRGEHVDDQVACQAKREV
jgi:hypothetical protein